jgi:hypothetical protein
MERCFPHAHSIRGPLTPQEHRGPARNASHHHDHHDHYGDDFPGVVIVLVTMTMVMATVMLHPVLLHRLGIHSSICALRVRYHHHRDSETPTPPASDSQRVRGTAIGMAGLPIDKMTAARLSLPPIFPSGWGQGGPRWQGRWLACLLAELAPRQRHGELHTRQMSEAVEKSTRLDLT